MTKTKSITFEEKNSLEVVPYEQAGMKVSDSMKHFRDEWTRSRAAEHLAPLMKTCPTCKRKFEFQLEYCSFDGSKLQIVPGE